MPVQLVTTPTYEKRVSKLLRPTERTQMECFIAATPDQHPVIPETGGFRKARWKRQGGGKSGGLRLIYYFFAAPEVVYMADIYAKNDQETLSHAQKNELKERAKQLKRIYGT